MNKIGVYLSVGALIIIVYMVGYASSGVSQDSQLTNFLIREGMSDSEIVEIMELPLFPVVDERGKLEIGRQRWASPDSRMMVILTFGKKCYTSRIILDYTGKKR